MSEVKNLLSLYISHRRQLVNYAANITGDRVTAEDIVQEAWARLGPVARARPLEEPTGYLYRIVRNLALDGRRRRSFEQRYFVEGSAEEGVEARSDAPTPEAVVASRDELRLVMEVIDGMPARMRTAVQMHRFEGAKLKDIAARLGISVTLAHELVAEGVGRCRARLRHPA